MGIIENASVTLEKIVEADGRVPSSLIKAEFDKIMTTGVIPPLIGNYTVLLKQIQVTVLGLLEKLLRVFQKQVPRSS